MKLKSNQSGFTLVESIIVIAIVGILAFVGLRIAKNSKQAADGTSATTSQTTIPSKINNKTDAQTASKALDELPIESKLDPNQLNTSLTSLL